jgi:hypothetical protein
MILDSNWFLNEGRQPKGPVKRKNRIHASRSWIYINISFQIRSNAASYSKNKISQWKTRSPKRSARVHALGEEMRRSHIGFDMIQENSDLR